MAHEGWKNYATWGVAILIDNDRDALDHAVVLANAAGRKMIARTRLADDLKEWVENMSPFDDGTVPNQTFATFMFEQLANAALSEVDWRELAAHYQAKAADTK